MGVWEVPQSEYRQRIQILQSFKRLSQSFRNFELLAGREPISHGIMYPQTRQEGRITFPANYIFRKERELYGKNQTDGRGGKADAGQRQDAS